MDDSQFAPEANPPVAGTSESYIPSAPAIENELAAITKAIFSQPGEFEPIHDPEWPDMKLVAISLDGRADAAALKALEQEWHRRVIAKLGTRAIGYALCVYRECPTSASQGEVCYG